MQQRSRLSSQSAPLTTLLALFFTSPGSLWRMEKLCQLMWHGLREELWCKSGDLLQCQLWQQWFLAAIRKIFSNKASSFISFFASPNLLQNLVDYPCFEHIVLIFVVHYTFCLIDACDAFKMVCNEVPYSCLDTNGRGIRKLCLQHKE